MAVHSERHSDGFQANSLDTSRERRRVHITVYVLRIEHRAKEVNENLFKYGYAISKLGGVTVLYVKQSLIVCVAV